MPYNLALVTGATSGIGEALCRLLASKGVNLLITGRRSKKLEELQKELSSQVSIESYPLDLTDPSDLKKLVWVVEEKVPDLVVNNAGFGLYGSACALSIQEQKEMIDLNIHSVVELSIVAANVLKKNCQKGVILNVSSVAAFLPFPSFAVYAATKSFVTSFSEAMNFELAPCGIHVLASCPGRVSTGFSKRASGDRPKKRGGPMMTAEYAAAQVFHQIQTKKAVHIFNWKYRLGAFLGAYIIPRWFLFGVLKRELNLQKSSTSK